MKITFRACYKSAPPNYAGWEETHESDKPGTAEEIIEALLANFNATLRPGEQPRRLVRIVSSEGTEPKPHVIPHAWEKQNLVTISDRHGMYDKMKCRVCGITGKRHGIGPRVLHDPKFDKPKFTSCTAYDL